MTVSCVIDASGDDPRMNSSIPTALHSLLGKPLVLYSMEALEDVCPGEPTVIIPEGSLQDFSRSIKGPAHFVEHRNIFRIGQAFEVALDQFNDQTENVLVLNARTPFLSPDLLSNLVNQHTGYGGQLTLLVSFDYDDRTFEKIHQYKITVPSGDMEILHAAAQELEKMELDPVAACCNYSWLLENKHRLGDFLEKFKPIKGLAGMMLAEGHVINYVQANDSQQVFYIENRHQLAQAETMLRSKINKEWMLAGVTLIDPERTYLDRDISIGKDTTIFPDTYLQGTTSVGEGCVIGPNSIIRDSIIGDQCTVISSVIEEARIENNVDVGPFSHLRKGAHLDQGVHVGNFGEVKNSYLGRNTKMGHFSYIGDATIGKNVNIGAGTITCNFDGSRKNPTVIEDNVFVGSDTMLIAPVRLKKGSRTGAGSVVTKDVPEKTIVAGVPARAVRKLRDDD